MSEQKNTDTIKTMYAAFARGDVQAIMNSLSDDVVWSLEGPSIIPFAGMRRGKTEVMGFFTALGTTQTNQKLTIDTYIAQGDHVATVGRYAATVTATGKSFDSRVAHVFTLRDGKVTALADFADTALMVEVYTHAAAAAR